MAVSIEQIQNNLYRTVNFISYKPKVDSVDYTREKLEDDLLVWLTELIDYVGNGTPNNLYNADGVLAGHRNVGLGPYSISFGDLVIDNNSNLSTVGGVTADTYVVSSEPNTDNSLSKLFAYNPLDGSFSLLEKNSITGTNTNIYNSNGAITDNRYIDLDGNTLEIGVSTNTDPAMKFGDSGSLLNVYAASYFNSAVIMQGSNVIVQPTSEFVLYSKAASTNNAGAVLVLDVTAGGTNGFVRVADLSSLEGVSIYNADGSLQGDRSVKGNETYSLHLGGTLNTEQLDGFTVRSGYGILSIDNSLYFNTLAFNTFRVLDNLSITGGFNISEPSTTSNILFGNDITSASDYVYALTDSASFALDSDGSAIIGGDSNSVSAEKAIVLGMSGFTATSANTTYVDNFYAQGTVKFDGYGLGNNTGTVAYSLGVDEFGNVIETTGGSGGTFTNGIVLPSSPSYIDCFYHTTDEILYMFINDGTNDLWLDISSLGGVGNESDAQFQSIENTEFPNSATNYELTAEGSQSKNFLENCSSKYSINSTNYLGTNKLDLVENKLYQITLTGRVFPTGNVSAIRWAFKRVSDGDQNELRATSPINKTTQNCFSVTFPVFECTAAIAQGLQLVIDDYKGSTGTTIYKLQIDIKEVS